MSKVDGNDVAKTLRENIANNFNLLAKMDSAHAIETAEKIVTQLKMFFGEGDVESSESQG